jgi:hypothetical protein
MTCVALYVLQDYERVRASLLTADEFFEKPAAELFKELSRSRPQ